MLTMKLLSEVKFFAEDHPFVQIHFISFKLKFTKQSLGIVGSLAKPLEGLF